MLAEGEEYKREALGGGLSGEAGASPLKCKAPLWGESL